MIALSNKYITAKVSGHGAELHSLIHNGFEYIWQADPKYWSRHAPILFPIVGRVFNDEYKVGDNTYHLPQHGFARDREFRLINFTDTEATFVLQSDDDTLKVYPYKFELIVKHSLQEKRLKTQYIVRNTDNKDIYFQIGGHPAFNYPNYPFNRGYLQLTKDGKAINEISVKHPNTNGYITNYIQHLELSNGCLPIKDDIFNNGAFILENDQCDTISMINGNGTTHLSLSSNAKLFGIWSPERKNAPFICIEPWFGRADDVNYEGDFNEKQFMNRLQIGKEMNFDYSIILK